MVTKTFLFDLDDNSPIAQTAAVAPPTGEEDVLGVRLFLNEVSVTGIGSLFGLSIP